MAYLIDSMEAVAGLADRVLDPDRERAVVCVTIPRGMSEPLVDVPALARALDGTGVDVYVLPTGELSWELSARLPTGLDVYGGAVRLWWPGVADASDRQEHPLRFAYHRSDSPRVIEQVVGALAQGGVRSRPRPPAGSEHPAVVTRVLPHGVELDLVADGTAAFAHRSHLSRHDLPPERVVRVGQAVRVRVSDGDPGRRRVPVSLRPFEPDPWDRLTEAYPVGAVVEVEVTELRGIGAFAAVLPGVVGLIHKSQISHEWVTDPADFLSVGDRVRARITQVEQIERAGEVERRVGLSMTDVPAEVEPDVPIVPSVYPDGPPWLAPQVEAVPPAFAALAPVSPRPRPAAEPVGLADVAASAHPPPTGPLVATPPTGPGVERAADPDEGPGVDDGPGEMEAGAASVDGDLEPADDGLEQVVAQARDVQHEVRTLLDTGERHLARLRGEAAQLRRSLEQDLAEVRRRVLQLAESESTQLIGSTQQALDAARAEAAQLREQLAAVEDDRQSLLARLREYAGRVEHYQGAARGAREELRRERETTRRLRDQLRRLAPDEHTLLQDEMYQAWQATTTPDDRRRYPWRQPWFGPEFLASLSQVEGVSRQRVVQVCAEVACGRAPHRPGLEVHPLRTGEGGDTPQRVRDDGARAYRASLQANTPAARRLHYWQHPDGKIEFAKIGYHDDFSIR